MTRPEDVVAQAIRGADGGHVMGAGELGEVAVKALRDADLLPNVGSGRRHGEKPAGGPELDLYRATHGDTAWEDFGPLAVARLIRWYRTLPGCAVGGSLHIVIEDSNCDDHHIEWCAGYAFGQGDTCGAELAGLLGRMDVYDRVCAVMLANGEPVNGVRLTDGA